MESLVAVQPQVTQAIYTPRIKKVLKSYQQAASNSIAGPNNFEPGWTSSSSNSTTSSGGLGPLKSQEMASSAAAALGHRLAIDGSGHGGPAAGDMMRSSSLSSSSSLSKVSPGSSSSSHSSAVKYNNQQQPHHLSSSNSGSHHSHQVSPLSSGGHRHSDKAEHLSHHNLSHQQQQQQQHHQSDFANNHHPTKSGLRGGTLLASARKPAESPDGCLLVVPPPLAIQKAPIIVPSDESTVLTRTSLRGETIFCFVIGGEQRLCLPQLLNTILDDYIMSEITEECINLQINCSRCSPGQLDALKSQGILPTTAPSCGLITRTDAEHLVSALVDKYPPRAIKSEVQAKATPLSRPPSSCSPESGHDIGGFAKNCSSSSSASLRVYHECFNKCTGLYKPSLYHEPGSACIECENCSGLYSPAKFVCHSHRPKVTRTIHWGFDSNNWRAYILLAENQGREPSSAVAELNSSSGEGNAENQDNKSSPPEEDEAKSETQSALELQTMLDDMKARFTENRSKRKGQSEASEHHHQDSSAPPTSHLDNDVLAKRLKAEPGPLPPPPLPPGLPPLPSSVAGGLGASGLLPGALSHLVGPSHPPPPLNLAYWGSHHHPSPGVPPPPGHHVPPGMSPFYTGAHPLAMPAWATADPAFLMYWYTRSQSAAYGGGRGGLEDFEASKLGGQCPISRMRRVLGRLETLAKVAEGPERSGLVAKGDRLRVLVKSMEEATKEFAQDFGDYDSMAEMV